MKQELNRPNFNGKNDKVDKYYLQEITGNHRKFRVFRNAVRQINIWKVDTGQLIFSV